MENERNVARQLLSDLENSTPPTEEHFELVQVKGERDALASDLRTLREKYYRLEDEVVQHRRKQETCYVLNTGEIKECKVLYSDKTSTILRFETGELILPSNEVLWSDYTHYKAQELLKRAMTEECLIPSKYVEAFALLLKKGYVKDESTVSDYLP
ncbi:coil containing protein [Vibrio phage 1.032.O._10N.261.54.F5]|nr:coil containing protein [Vibrio phage 1.032.O._10N.261.54.F5]